MYFLFPIFIFTYLFWLCRVLTAALRIFDVCRGMQTLSCSMQDLSSLTRDQTHAPALRVQSRSPCCCLIAKSCPTPLQPHGLKPTRILCSWNFPGKNTGVGCHFLLWGSFRPGNQACISCIGRLVLYHHQGSTPNKVQPKPKGSFSTLTEIFCQIPQSWGNKFWISN